MDLNATLMAIADKIPSESLPIVQDRLKSVSEEKLNAIAILPLKSHIVGLILGLFFGFFGIDRFYKGDIGLGIAKLALWIVGIATVAIYVGVFILCAVYVWAVVDLFLVWKGIKKDNLQKILQVLG